MSKLAGISRAALLGTLCAMVAFSYAIATVESASVVDSVDARGVGTSQLRFTNPLVNGDRDLGLVALGGSFTRFARAAGGLPPYTFSSPTGATEFGLTRFVGSTLVSGAVDFSGKVSGLVGTIVGGNNFQNPLNGALRFNIKVVDQAVGTAGVTESFILTLDQTGVFKFANGPDLGSTVRFQDFVSTLDTVNAKGAVTFASTAASGITGVTALSDVGLFLDKSGKLFGKPYVNGTLTFTVEATDSTGAKAKARDGTGASQAFTLVIENSVDINSDIVVTKAQVKYDSVKSTKKASDTVAISGLLNVKGAKISDFTGKKFSTQIGNFVSKDGTLDAKGKANDKVNGVTVQVSTKGTFKASYKGLNISALFAPGVADKASQTLATAVTLSASVSAAEALNYSAKGTFPKQTLSYALGKNAAPAGAFLITKVSGRNSKDGLGTAFKADFIGIPGATAAKATTNGSFGTGVSAATVNIGNGTDSSLVATLKGTKVSAKSKSKANNTVKSLALDSAKGKGKVDANAFVATASGIPVAADGVTTKFPLAVAVRTNTQTVFNGFGSTSIFGKKTSYKSVNPAK